jgi:hypothetical protein
LPSSAAFQRVRFEIKQRSKCRLAIASSGLAAVGAETAIVRIRAKSNLLPLKRLARSIALVREEAPATGAGATMTRDLSIRRLGGLPGLFLSPQLLHADTDCLEIVSCSGP